MDFLGLSPIGEYVFHEEIPNSFNFISRSKKKQGMSMVLVAQESPIHQS
jgi:hypothetical protein